MDSYDLARSIRRLPEALVRDVEVAVGSEGHGGREVQTAYDGVPAAAPVEPDDLAGVVSDPGYRGEGSGERLQRVDLPVVDGDAERRGQTGAEFFEVTIFTEPPEAGVAGGSRVRWRSAGRGRG